MSKRKIRKSSKVIKKYRGGLLFFCNIFRMLKSEECSFLCFACHKFIRFSFISLVLITSACNSRPLETSTQTRPPIISTKTSDLLKSAKTATATIAITPSLYPTKTPLSSTKLPAWTPIPPSETPTAFPPTNTSTPLPTLSFHGWKPDIILANYSYSGGDGPFVFPELPILRLFFDGQLFITSEIEVKDNWYEQVKTKRLSREEICELLNTIDQTGFFDYDEDSYRINRFGEYIDWFQGDGGAHHSINVNAWRVKDVNLYALWWFINELESGEHLIYEGRNYPTILPSLYNTYRLLTNYEPEGMEIYKPEYLEILIHEPGWSSDVQNWTLSSPSLLDLFERAEKAEDIRWIEAKRVIIDGDEAKAVYNSVDKLVDHYGTFYTDGNLILQVYISPLLPYHGMDNQAVPNRPMMYCDPSDGVLPIPYLP